MQVPDKATTTTTTMGFEAKNFGDFLDGLCTPDTLERVLVKYGLDEAGYRLKLWRDMVQGHQRILTREKDEELREKYTAELDEVLRFGKATKWVTTSKTDGSLV
jgi:hypothetical protein